MTFNVQELRELKKEKGYSNQKIAELSGVSIGTVQKVFSGETESPRHDTLVALSKIFEKNTASYSSSNYTSKYHDEFHDSGYVYGTSAVSNRPIPFPSGIGDKTIDDYYALPEDVRAELIDGYFYVMEAPSTLHQAINLELGSLLRHHVKSNGGKCMPFVSPIDVQLDCDGKTMVQPDVIVVCDRSKITKKVIYGAPDFIIEIVSPGSQTKDAVKKLIKYKNAGVKEYWIVYPEERIVAVYDFTKSDFPMNYSFNDKIPVGIWDGKFKINFDEIYTDLEFMYDLK